MGERERDFCFENGETELWKKKYNRAIETLSSLFLIRYRLA